MGMLTPLLHITMPEDDGEDRHFAPIIFALQAMINVNRWHIQRGLERFRRGKGPRVPLLYESGVRYKEDPPGQENWKDCLAVLAEGTGDCLPLSTLVLRDDFTTVPLASLRPGDRVMGDGAWTQVQESMMTGEKDILAFTLSNGCVLRCSPEHRLFRDVDGKVEEVHARDVRVRDDLVTPQSIPLSPIEDIGWPDPMLQLSEQDRAWLLGVFVADGWVDGENGAIYRAAISGLDGKPKEAQKRRVEALMNVIDVPTRWHAKYIAINHRPIAEFFAKCGHTAPNKHLESVGFASETGVRAALEGLQADASIETRPWKTETIVYGTTSRQLALQIRILYRMLGISVSMRRVDNHGGFGDHPIYRVTPRLQTREGYAERREKKFARVRSIADGGTELCGDITTDSGKFWLPESDVLVHNCDRLVAWRVAELDVAGIPTEPVIKWQQVPRNMMIQLGHPAQMVPPEGISMVHVLVRYNDPDCPSHGDSQRGNGMTYRAHAQCTCPIEDPSKILGMGGDYTNGI